MGSNTSSRPEPMTINEKLNNEIKDKIGIKKDPESVKKFKEFFKQKFREKQLIKNIHLTNSLNDKNNLVTSINSMLSVIYSLNIDQVKTSFYETAFFYDIVEPGSNVDLFYSRKLEALGGLIDGKREIEMRKAVSIGSAISIMEKKILLDDTIANTNTNTITTPPTTGQDDAASSPLNLNKDVSDATETKNHQTLQVKEKPAKKTEDIRSMISPKDTIIPQKTRSVSKTRRNKKQNKLPVVNIRINLKDLIKQEVYETSILDPKDRLNLSKSNKPDLNPMTDVSELAQISKLNYTQTNVNDGSFLEIVDMLLTSENTRAEPKVPGYTTTTRTHSNDKYDGSKPKQKITKDQFCGVASQFPLEEYKNKIKYKGKNTEKSIVI